MAARESGRASLHDTAQDLKRKQARASEYVCVLAEAACRAAAQRRTQEGITVHHAAILEGVYEARFAFAQPTLLCCTPC
jgi:hypothetical protein